MDIQLHQFETEQLEKILQDKLIELGDAYQTGYNDFGTLSIVSRLSDQFFKLKQAQKKQANETDIRNILQQIAHISITGMMLIDKTVPETNTQPQSQPTV